MRTLQIIKLDGFDDVTVETTLQVNAAVGRLSTWGIDSERYAAASLTLGRHGDIYARYRNAAGEVTYDILGQRDVDGSYSFHS